VLEQGFSRRARQLMPWVLVTGARIDLRKRCRLSRPDSADQPGEQTVQQIAAVLGLPLAYFYCEDDDSAYLLQCFHTLEKDDRKQVIDLAERLATRG
jgi:hypothetical protein